MTTPVEPTEEQIAARARRADRATRGAFAGVLGLEALVLLMLPRALAFTQTGLGVTRTVIIIVAAVIMIAAAALMRRPFGIGLGSALQVVLLCTGVMLIAMLVVAVIFAAIWCWLLKIRHDLVLTPGGWRVLVS